MPFLEQHGGFYGGMGGVSKGKQLIKVIVQDSNPLTAKKGDVWIKDTPTPNHKVLINKQNDSSDGDYFLGVGSYSYRFNVEKSMSSVNETTAEIYFDVYTSSIVNDSGYLANRVEFWSNSIETLLVRMDVTKKLVNGSWVYVNAYYYTGDDWKVFSPNEFSLFFISPSPNFIEINNGEIVFDEILPSLSPALGRVLTDQYGNKYLSTVSTASSQSHRIRKYNANNEFVSELILSNSNEHGIVFSNTMFYDICIDPDVDYLYLHINNNIIAVPFDLSTWTPIYSGFTTVSGYNSKLIVLNGKMCAITGASTRMTVTYFDVMGMNPATLISQSGNPSTTFPINSILWVGDYVYIVNNNGTIFKIDSTGAIAKELSFGSYRTFLSYLNEDEFCVIQYNTGGAKIYILDYELNVLRDSISSGTNGLIPLPTNSTPNMSTYAVTDRDGSIYYLSLEVSSRTIAKVTSDLTLAWKYAHTQSVWGVALNIPQYNGSPGFWG